MQDPLVLEVDLFFNFFFIAWTVDTEDMTVNWLGGGVTCSKGTQAGSRTQVHCSKDKDSVHRTPTVPTELNGAPELELSEPGVSLVQPKTRKLNGEL